MLINLIKTIVQIITKSNLMVFNKKKKTIMAANYGLNVSTANRYEILCEKNMAGNSQITTNTTRNDFINTSRHD